VQRAEPKFSVETDPRSMYDEVLIEAAVRAMQYLRNIGERRAGVTQEAIQQLARLGGMLPAKGEDPTSVLRLLDEIGSPATVASTGRRFFGGVIGGALPASVAAHWLADAWDQNACLFDFSPVSAYLETVVLDWLLHLFGLPPGSGGAFVTGTQMADVTALAAARCYLLQKAGWDFDDQGLFGAPPITVVVGEEVHATMLKALRLLGFGKSQLRIVPADSQGRMRAAAIPQVHGPLIVCAQVGNVNTGACDPVADICEAASQMKAWVHVDGAFGLWAATSPARKPLVDGIAGADSWATDFHKWLNVPQDSGIAIVRDREALQRAMAIGASYYPDPSSGRDPMQWVPESSRRARAVEIWAALRSLGMEGIANLVERTCKHAERFANGFRDAGYEVLNEVMLNQVMVSFGDDETTSQVIQAIQADGTCWCGGTTWRGRKAMRISVSSWATTTMDVDQSLEAMLKVARAVGTVS
jgi:glutamate/tyrosine decarboxylase-like PLP-dependent enzyme